MSSSLPIVVDDALLKCPLCCRSADDPRLLPCLHIFCRSCLVNYIDKYNANQPEGEGNPEKDQPQLNNTQQQKCPRSAIKSSPQFSAPHHKKFASLSRQTSTGCTLPPPPSVPPPLPSSTMSMTTQSSGLEGDYEEEDGYEVPNDHQFNDRDTYEDVDQDPEGRMYVNSSPPSCESRRIERGNIGYVTMGHRRAEGKPPQQQNVRRRCRSAPRTRPTTVAVSGLTGESPSPSCRRSPSPSNRGKHAQRQVLDKSFSVNDDGLYENSEDDVDDVIQENRKSRIIPSAREVRRWKVAGESSGVPPRMKRRIRRDPAAASSSSTGASGHTSCIVTPDALRTPKDEKRRGVTMTPTGSSSSSPNRRRPEISSFEYIYGDRQRQPSNELLPLKPETTSKADTLDRHIPVYEVFKSAKISEKKSLQNVFEASTTDGYVELEQRRTQATDGLYGIEQTLDIPSRSEQVDSQMVNVGVREFTCPVCDEHVPVLMAPDQENGTCDNNLQPYGVSVPFISAMTELVRLQTVDCRHCECCNAPSAVSRCLQCRRDLCSTCRDSHSRLEELGSQHHVVDLHDVQSGRHQRELIQTGLPVTPCSIHPTRKAVGFCTACDATVCDQCRSSDLIDDVGPRRHRDAKHNVIEMTSAELEEAAGRERDMVSATLLSDVERRVSQLKTDGDRIASYRRDIETERDKALQILAQKKERLLSAVEKCYGELVQSIEEEYSFERQNVRALTAASDKNSARVDHALRFARHLFELGRPADVTSLAAVVRSGLRSACLVPEVTIDARLTVDFLSTDDVKIDRIRRLFGAMTIDRIPCAVVEPKEELGGSILSDSGIGCSPGSIDRRKRRKSSTSDVDTTQRVRRKPSVRDPVLVTSFSAKTELDEKGCKPTGIAVVDDPDVVGRCLIVIVDDINKKLKVFDATNGQLHLEIKPEGRQRLVDPWDVAVLRRLPVNCDERLSVRAGDSPAMAEVLSKPRFVVSDRGARDVKTFTESGEFVTSFGRHLSSPWGVATSATTRQILVTDAAHKTVFVHDTAGNVLFCVQSKVGDVFQLQCPEYVAVSPVNGDIIVTDFERHTVVFFDKLGRFLTQYSGDNEEPTAPDVSSNTHRRLKVPCGVAVSCAEDGGRVYVADYNNRRIVRLSRNGRYDACFAASNSIALVSPQAIDFTLDGLLVVADRTNLKVFDVGVRSGVTSSRRDVDGSSFVVTAVQQDMAKSKNTRNDEVTLKSQEVVVNTINATATPVKPRPIGPKPIIAPRPKPQTGRVGTVPAVETVDGHHTVKTSISTMMSSAGTASITTMSSAGTDAASTSRRRSSVTSVLPGTILSNFKIPKSDSDQNATMVTRSYLETEVW